jgi:hypothetical protein
MVGRTAPQIFRALLGTQDMEPQDESVGDLGGEYAGAYRMPSQDQVH